MNTISLSNISFAYPRNDDLFSGLNAVFNDCDVVAIIGDNGCGKSTLLKLIAGEIIPDTGRVTRGANVYYMQQLSTYDNISGGQHQLREIMRAFNSGADILLLDEPTNNLDANAREKLFDLIHHWHGGIIIVSHDRALLNQVDYLMELRDGKLNAFGGNYDFYTQMRDAHIANLHSQYVDATKEIRRLKQTAVNANAMASNHESKQSRDRANHKRSRLEGNALKGKSRETAARRNQIIDKKITVQQNRCSELSMQLRDDKIKIPIPATSRHGHELINIERMSFSYDNTHKIFDNFSFRMRGGERVHIMGNNGCGKTTLVRLILGQLMPTSGTIKRNGRAIYLNQTLSALNPNVSIVQNIMDFGAPDINSAYAIAANFGFRNVMANKLVRTLSGGELLKATLAAVIGGENQPDLLILDEPTNNLDIKSMTVLEDALNQFRGALLLISHDEIFVRNINNITTLDLD